MMRRMVVVLFVLLVTVPLTGRADLVTNGGFETGTLAAWSFSGLNTGVDTVPHTGTYGCVFAQFGATNYIEQTLTTEIGKTYALGFWLGNVNAGGTRTFDVYWNGTHLLGLSGSADFDYTEYAFNVTGTGSDVLKFEGRHDGTDGYWKLDDVTVGDVVPEFGSVVPLALSVLGGTGWILRRRRW